MAAMLHISCLNSELPFTLLQTLIIYFLLFYYYCYYILE